MTGCTVKQDLGDGYTAIYGQLKELNFKKGDMIEAGQTIGYVGEPTKYYSTEGSNVYFELQKDGKPVNPKEYLPEMPMNIGLGRTYLTLLLFLIQLRVLF